MGWFDAPDYSIARWLLERGLGLIYLVAFLNAGFQFRPLLGEHGLLPVPRYLRYASLRDAPSLFQLAYSDRLLVVVAWSGVLLAGSLLVGLPQAGPLWLPMLVWLVLWVLYLSIVNVGQTFYAFGWESLLCEAGFLAIFLGNSATAPPVIVLWLFRWLTFRVEFGAGLIKLRGDPCWRDLTCMDYHHETQPMPNPLSWFFHHLPRRLHRVEVVGNYVAQLAAPIGLFLPQPIAAVSALIIIGTQGYLLVSGNYAWLNLITLTIAIAAIPDAAFGLVLPIGSPELAPAPVWFMVAVAGLGLLVAVLSYWPVRNLLGRRQLMNYSFNRLHLVNTYGAFGSVSRERYEIVVEGSAAERPESRDWHAYEFRGKPTDPARRPPQVAPYHLRLDWLMWFAALSPAYAEGWFLPLLERLLAGDRSVRGLLRHDPFGGSLPRWVRARLFRYRFSTTRERRSTGAWWYRELVGDYVPAVRRSEEGTANNG
jgi:Lipase maturation factor